MLNRALLNGARPLGIALSGGSDSTALLVLAAEEIGPQHLRAVTVDHGLRPEAAAEARDAAQLCDKLDVAHDTIAISLKKGGDLQARAREARYAALSHWAAQNQIAAIALGHTQDDMAETFLIRLARGSGVDGLSAMPERFERGGVRFLRPLLAAHRSDLQQLLEARGLSWSSDPSNDDPSFTRVRMRQAMPELEALGLSSARLAQTAHWMRAASDVLEEAADQFIARHARAEYGDAVFDAAALQAAPEETALRVLSRALCAISGNAYRPRLEALKALQETKKAVTLHGCLAYQQGGALRITQELQAAQKGPSRWRIDGPIEVGMQIAPLGDTGLAMIKNWRDTALLPRRSLRASPGIWRNGILVAAPLAAPDEVWTASTPNPLLLAN